jgi:uncharacterized protein (DUF952 family)
LKRIYHLVPPSTWRTQVDVPYEASSLASEGFIHCSKADQVERVANLFYAAEPELLVLVIDTDRLTSVLRDEDIGTGERFPHVYGPINREAIRTVERLERGADGNWVLGDPEGS